MLKIFFKNVPSRIFQRSLSNLPKVGQYKKLSEGTAEDFQNSQIHFAQHGSPEAIAKRLLGMVKDLENKGKYLCTFSGFSHYTASVLFKYLFDIIFRHNFIHRYGK